MHRIVGPRSLAVVVLILSFAFSVISPNQVEAHRNGCHRWHSCPSDTGSYVCGDLGYDTYCPNKNTPPPAPAPAPAPPAPAPRAPAPAPAPASPAPAPPTTPRCFSETGQCLEGRLRQYWEQNGGLPVFGFPIAAQGPEQNRDTGQTYETQWMERNRFEVHPENQAPYDVLLGRLGDDRLRQKGIDWQTLPKAAPSTPHFFAQTGHGVAHEPFWQYWSTHGLELGDRGNSERESLGLFGLPISEPAMETNASGDTVLTQWFERARFEYHPNNPDPFKVLLGLLGNEVRANQNPGTVPPPAPAPSPSPSPAPQPSQPSQPAPGAAITIEGSGQKVTDPITLPAGINKITLTHTGKRNFIVWAYGPNDARDLIANTIGTFTGVRPLEGTGQWFFEVNADGAWKIVVEPLGVQQDAANGISGQGQFVSGTFTPTRQGRVPYTFSHTGERNFIVWIRCAGLGGDDLVANTIGTAQGEVVAEFGAAPCYWDVVADGQWSVRPK